MHSPAFIAPVPLLARHTNSSLSATRVTMTVPRPAGPPPAQAQFRRAQEGREGFYGPTYSSDLKDSSTAKTSSETLRAIQILLGNAYVFESELALLTPILTRYETSADARELVREVAKSSVFRSRYFDSVSNSRFAELCYKLLLARAPANQRELASTLSVLEKEGYDAAIDSIVDSEEYAARFGNVLFPFMTVSGVYEGGMPSFCAQMLLQLSTRGGNSDVTCRTPRISNIMNGGVAGVVEIDSAYRVSVPRYEPQMNWMDLPRSSLSTDWASMSLVPSDAAASWAGGSPRETGQADGPWEAGWKPRAKDEWESGWSLKIYKSYV